MSLFSRTLRLARVVVAPRVVSMPCRSFSALRPSVPLMAKAKGPKSNVAKVDLSQFEDLQFEDEVAERDVRGLDPETPTLSYLEPEDLPQDEALRRAIALRTASQSEINKLKKQQGVCLFVVAVVWRVLYMCICVYVCMCCYCCCCCWGACRQTLFSDCIFLFFCINCGGHSTKKPDKPRPHLLPHLSHGDLPAFPRRYGIPRSAGGSVAGAHSVPHGPCREEPQGSLCQEAACPASSETQQALELPQEDRLLQIQGFC